MGNCLYVIRRRELGGGPTFSHYSLTSTNSFLDLYPGLSYVETEIESSCQQSHQWRRSSAPLLDCWESSSDTPSPPMKHSNSIRPKGGGTSPEGDNKKVASSHILQLQRRSIQMEVSHPDSTSTVTPEIEGEERTAADPEASLAAVVVFRRRERQVTQSNEKNLTSTVLRNRDSNSTIICEI